MYTDMFLRAAKVLEVRAFALKLKPQRVGHEVVKYRALVIT